MITTTTNDDSSGTSAPQVVQGKFARARRVLQDEIDEHKNLIIEKTRRLNDLVDINCLPPELLAEIFFQWVAATRIVSSTKWIQIAHVCHIWREVALSTPKLWSEFIVGRMNWTREMLLRSKQTPLRVSAASLSLTRGDSLEVMKLVFRELPRIEYISLRHIVGFTNHLDSFSTAPLLRSLTIHGEYHHHVPGPLPLAFEKMEIPKLAYLDLAHTQLPWTTTLFKPSVTRLIFRGSHAHIGRYRDIEFVQVLRVLENMPLLEHLDLANVLPAFPSDQTTLPELNHYVSLPVLQTLILSASPKSCAFLLQHLNFSTSTSMEIECWTTPSESLLDVTSVIAAKLRSSTSPARPVRSIICSGGSVRAWQDVIPLDTLAQDVSLVVEPKPRLCFSVLPNYHTWALSPVLASLPLHAVQNVVINANTGVKKSTDEWLKIFAGMRGVRELGVFEWFDEISEALGRRVPLTANQRKSAKGKWKKGDIPLPNLKVISLSNVMFRDYMDEPDEDSIIGDYKKMLRTRKTAQRRVERLVIKQAINFDCRDVEDLRVLVKEVVWDGDEDFIDEEDEDEDDDEDDEDEYFDEGGYEIPYWFDDDDMLYPW